MRIRSTLAVTLGALLLTLLSGGSADADTRVPVFGASSGGVRAAQTACDSAHEPTGVLEKAAYTRLTSERSSPLHDDSLEITAGLLRVAGLAIDLPSSADLATLRLSAWGTPAMRVSVLTADGWLPSVPAGSTPRHQPSGWYDLARDAAFPSDLGPVTAFLWFGRCGMSEDSVLVDALSVGPPGDVTTYDFEGADNLRLDMLGASGAPGRARWSLYCGLSSQPDMTQLPEPVSGEPITLESRPHGSGNFRVLGVARTSKYGQAVFHDRPRRLTDYRCRYGGRDGSAGHPYPASVSSVFALKVPTHVTIRVRRTDHGRRVLATGTADPRHPGTRVTLLVKGFALDAQSRVLDRGRLTRRGTYELSARLGKGPWLVYVRIAKAPGNAAATSAERSVK
jgi:hypothetical protein